MDEGEGDESEEEGIKFVETGEDTPLAFESSEQPFYLVAFLVQLLVVLPGVPSGAQRGHHRHISQVQRELPGFVALVGPVHHQVTFSGLCAVSQCYLGSLARYPRALQHGVIHPHEESGLTARSFPCHR